MSTSKLFAVALAAVMLLSVFALPGAAVASAEGSAVISDDDEVEDEEPESHDEEDADDSESDDEDEGADDENDADNESAGINVSDGDGEYTVSVTNDDGEDVAETTVTVETVDNVSYADVGNHTTNDNGTFALEAPDNESVEVALETTVDNETLTTTATLDPLEDSDDAEPENFGALVSSFVENAEDDDGPLGLQVASFVLENNPGNAPDHAGPPAHAGPSGDDEQGPPAHAGGSDGDDEQGPPAHAGGPDEDEDDKTTEEDSDDGDDADDEDEQTDE